MKKSASVFFKSLLPLLSLLLSHGLYYVHAQQAGDFKTSASGSWLPEIKLINEEEVYVNIWDVFDGNAWIPVTESCDIQYPGEDENNFNYSVTIRAGDSVSINTTEVFNLETLVIFGKVVIYEDFSLVETNNVKIDGGTIVWKSNSAMYLPENSSFVVFNYDPAANNGLQGEPCNNNRRIYIGTIAYAACTGGGNVEYTFSQINYAGGSLAPNLFVCNESICLDQNTGNPLFPTENPIIEFTSKVTGFFTDSAECVIHGTGPNDFEFISDTFYFYINAETEIYPDSIIHYIPLEGGFGDYSFEFTATDYWSGNSLSVVSQVRLTVNSVPADFVISQDLTDEVINGNPAVVKVDGLLPETKFSAIYNIANGSNDTVAVLSDINGSGIFETMDLYDWMHNDQTMNLIKIINSETQCESMSGADLTLEVSGGWPLPVDLLSFSASCNNNRIDINWVTATEINNDYFVLERSDDLINFHEIAIIRGHGFSNIELFYSYTDTEPLIDHNYYRLIQVDYDGTYKNYDIISINCSQNFIENQKYRIFPNPFIDVVNVELLDTEQEILEVEIYNKTGVLVQKFSNSSRLALPLHKTFNLNSLKPGVYLLRIVTDSCSFTEIILKQ